ncbi:MAG: DUF1003 domain-containing protein [Chloroflexi bacterium CFX7]|nr:MAG: DUF1003 domain-containing protein [bacterium]MCE7928782.1 DUF1003 domain-containing protein [Chloroflexi bacterium CFX7]MCL4231265.1 DUF1003 domain-containing protein [Dehalococcoidia bacterium]RIL02060.1 MAG: hypothetical protein DCC78_08280 [bacterium]
MAKLWLHPYRSEQEVQAAIERLHRGRPHVVSTQRVLAGLRAEQPAIARFNGALADHVVGLAGTMAFFYLLCLVMGAWVAWQSWIGDNTGFDPFPFAFLFFILGGIMQSLFVPTMLTASNRAAARDRIKDEADHRAMSHLYDVNAEQLALLHALAGKLLDGDEAARIAATFTETANNRHEPPGGLR